MASNKDNVILISILNKGIDEARKTGVLDKISKKWLGTTYGHQKSFLERYILPLSAAAGCLLMLCVWVWAWNIRLRTLVRKKTDVILQREKALFESEKNFRAFFDTMDDMIFVSGLDSKICYSNPAASMKLRYSQAELEKMYMVEVHPSEVRQEAEECFSAICKGEINACPLPLQSKTGLLIPSQTTCWLGQWNKIDSIFFISRDLSKEQEALQKFNRLFNNNPALMSVTSLPDKKFTDINDAFINALGFSREEILGKTSKELNLFIDQEESRRFAEEFEKKGRILNSEYRIRCKNGMILDGLFSCEAIESQRQQFFLTVMIDQTRRKQTETALRESEERFRSIFDNSLDGIVFATLDGTIFAANPAICNMLGFSKREICEGGRDLVVDKTDPKLAQALQELERTEKFKGEINHRRKDGVSFPIEISIKVFSSEKGDKRLVIIFRDVTDRKTAENKLAKVLQEQKIILDNTNIGISMMIDRKQIWINRKVADLFQYSKEELEGQTTRKLYPSQEAFEHLGKEAYPILAQGHVYKTEQLLLRRDGTPIWVRYNGKAIEPSDMSRGTIWLSEDITEQKRIEEEHRQWERQRQQIEKAESLNRMAGAVAHHFNNMLGAVMGNIELAVMDLPPGSDAVEPLSDAMKASQRAAEVSSLMLTYLGQIVTKPELLDLSNACRSSLPLLKVTLQKDVVLVTDFLSPGPTINANANQIQQLLSNLVANAAESIGNNPGTINLTVSSVSLTAVPEKNRIPVDWQPQGNTFACIEVKDTGSGIEDKDIAQIFDPFFSTKFTGRGLGLAVAIGIVRTHNGAITVESVLGQGSIFRVYLPLSLQPVPLRSEKRSVQTPEMESGGTILLVEDEEIVRKMVMTMLSHLGFKVLEAKDGVEAVEIFQQQKVEISVVLCDLTMPRMDGWETLAALREIKPDIPVILSSGYSESQVMIGDHPQWPQFYLSKPYILEELRTAINHVSTNRS